MPVIAEFSGIIIRLLRLRSLGHRLHAFYGDGEVVIDLADLKIVGGRVPERIGRLVLDWARLHRLEILRAYPAALG